MAAQDKSGVAVVVWQGPGMNSRNHIMFGAIDAYVTGTATS